MSPSEKSRQETTQSNEKSRQPDSRTEPDVPAQILQQADRAAAAATATDQHRDSAPDLQVEPPIDDVPPPPYSASQYGEIDINEKGIDTGARVTQDGRVNIKISSKNRTLTNLLRHQLEASEREPSPEPEIPEGLGYVSGLPPPPMNIVIQIVGSRGDVQPFVALGQVLKDKFNHRIRIATHPVFKDFVTDNGLEFFSIGGDPAELMAFMVKHPGLMPGLEAIRSGDIGKRRKGIYEMINGCWRSCIEPGDGTGVAMSDDHLEGQSIDSGISVEDPTMRPFVADAIIANPPSFAHLHVAEKLGVPLHLMFTMPWSPTQSFPHPLANVTSTNADVALTNYLSYIMVDLLTWQGIGDLINRFREKVLRLEPLSIIWAPGNLHRLKIPWTYCWSPALIPKPADWRKNIDLSGFYFLNLATNYNPPDDLDEFLKAGPPPVYIGFGSIVVDDPNAMTKLIFEAVKKSGQRALVSKGWGGFSGDEMGVPEGVFMLGNCPHDWLFQKVSCVVHHGGAGTTAAGIAAGRPTIVVPFFGDQQFWGQMCHRAGAGPEPIPNKELTADKLADAINFALKPDVLNRAKEMCEKIKQEQGCDSGAESFHRHLPLSSMRCSICPGRAAVWQYKKSGVRLSALAATVLANEKLLDFSELRLHRAREYIPDTGPPEPISGGAAALVGSLGQLGAGVADYPAEIWKSFRKGSSQAGGNESPAASASSLAMQRDTRASSSRPSGGSSSLLEPQDRDALVESPNASSTNLAGQSQDSGIGTPNASTSPSARPSKPTRDRFASSTSIVVTDADQDASSNVTPQAPSEPEQPVPSDSTNSLHPSHTPRQSVTSVASRDSEQDGSQASTRRERSPARERAQQITTDSLLGSAKATGNMVAVGMKSPLDFTMSMAQGFHNAPKLYGDKTVRPTEKVTGFHSGLRAAGKEFGYGMYDGITGLVTQPLQGAKEEGFAGLGKGFIRGSLGLFFKPGAAMWGIPGYTMKGVYAEIVKNFGKSTTNLIIAARTAQGYEEWKQSGEGECERIISTWKSDVMRKRATSKRASVPDKDPVVRGDRRRFYDENGQLLKGFSATRHLSMDDRKELEKLRKEEKKEEKEEKKKKRKSKGKEAPIPNRTENVGGSANLAGSTDEEIERAIRTAVQETSQNDPEEDARIERAIRASVLEYRRKMNSTSDQSMQGEDEDDAYQRAMAASVAEYQRQPQPSNASQPDVVETSVGSREEGEEFTRALMASLEESRRIQSTRNTHGQDGGTDTEDDEDYRKAIEASKNAPGPTRSHDDSDEDYQRAMEESKKSSVYRSEASQNAAPSSSMPTSSPPPGYAASSAVPSMSGQDRKGGATEINDKDLEVALKASENEAQWRETEVEKQKREEDIVLEYVKRQSLAEEEYRKRVAQGESGTQS